MTYFLCIIALFLVKEVFRKKPKLEKRLSNGDFCSSKSGSAVHSTSEAFDVKRGGALSHCGGVATDDDSSPECLDHTVPLTCPITRQLMRYPARGDQCEHIQCFDLESYLRANSDRLTWKCPICKQSALIEHVIIDDYLEKIINELKECVMLRYL